MERRTLEERVLYDLAYFGEDRETELAIVRALARLPEDVREFALTRCRFSSVGRDASGWTMPGRLGVDAYSRSSRNVWLIMLEERPPKSRPVEETVGHEVAHAWLRHDLSQAGPIPEDIEDDWEVRAAAQARAWGFDGPAANPERERRKLERHRRGRAP